MSLRKWRPKYTRNNPHIIGNNTIGKTRKGLRHFWRTLIHGKVHDV